MRPRTARSPNGLFPKGSRMNFALSQRRPDRHPVGLLVVVGLHGVLAAALLSARLQRAPSDPPPAPAMPLDPLPPVERKTVDLPQPAPSPLHPMQAPMPLVPDVAREETITAAPVDDKPAPPPVVAAAVGEPAVSAALRVQPHPAHINAGAAQCRPEYPAAAQRAGATGVSRIRFTVDATGRVAGAQILSSSGPTREHRLLDKAAAEALAQCPVTPGTDEMGRPVGATTDVEYLWRLD